VEEEEEREQHITEREITNVRERETRKRYNGEIYRER
jgi:hypothetical protein